MLAQLTPKQIDQLEAQRDSDDALARALTYAKQKRAEDHARAMAVELREPVPVSILLNVDRLAAADDSRSANAAAKGRRRPMKAYEAFGEKKPLIEWARIYGRNAATLRNAIYSGIPLEEALTVQRERGRGPKGKLYAFNGETLSLTEWSARTGIAKTALVSRLHLGWTLEKALTTPNQRTASRAKRDRGEGQSTCEASGTGVGSLAREREELGFFQCPL